MFKIISFWKKFLEDVQLAVEWQDPDFLFLDSRIKISRMLHKIKQVYFTPEQIETNLTPLTVWHSDRQGKTSFATGPILKICPKCLHRFQGYFNYQGGRYGWCGQFLCLRPMHGSSRIISCNFM